METTEGGFDVAGAEGFSDEVVHSGLEALLAVGFGGESGEGANGDVAVFFACGAGADEGGGFDAGDFGHFDIHKDDIEVV